MAAMEAEAPGELTRHAAAAAMAALVAVPKRVARPDGDERKALERPGGLFGSHFVRRFALLRTRLGSTPVIFLPDFRNAPALFLDVLGAGEKLDGGVAPAVVVAFKRTAARKADANGGLGVAATQGLSLALPVMTSNVAEMLMVHRPP
jgi:hypothetical protein